MSRFFGPRRFQGLKLLSEEFQVSVQSLNKLIFVTTKEFLSVFSICRKKLFVFCKLQALINGAVFIILIILNKMC